MAWETTELHTRTLERVLASNSVSDAIAIIRDELRLDHVTYHLVFNIGAPLWVRPARMP